MNKFNDFVNWNSSRLTLKKLQQIASLLGGKQLAAILKNYTKQYKFWNHGMPDLILWNAKTVKFSEVKSETDRLSAVQQAWLTYFSENEINCEVCLVNWKVPDNENAEIIDVF
jgi:hypothetical protein